ncbi:PREDICTED: uncharacterized protein LOC109585045 [Amphimedon queenslandica]|nr:PREDICTED: uncharacterized protein LOC109585045 [Amphimedon queenslandica]|eukprot:XP_019856532.1 PREDICTED: uncharacterized protein LOC109585045 [Amphimedon queenslandica]
MASNSETGASGRSGTRIRMTFNIEFQSVAEKGAFSRRLEDVRSLLSKNKLDNFGLMTAMFDVVEDSLMHGSSQSPAGIGRKRSEEHEGSSEIQSFNRNSGVFTGNDKDDDEDAFLVENYCLNDLVEGLVTPCCCGKSSNPWMFESIVKRGHVARLLFVCWCCQQQKRTWSSSRVFGGHYLLNQKMIHSFTCAGMLPTQYIKFCQFACIGNVGHQYIWKVYNKCGFIEVVNGMAEDVMIDAVEEVKRQPSYNSSGEWVITDARHDSTANAFYTTVPCLSGSTHKVLDIATVSRADHSIAQTREVACTKVVLHKVISKGVNVVEVAHDIQQQVSNYITKDLNLKNSFDTWHG